MYKCKSFYCLSNCVIFSIYYTYITHIHHECGSCDNKYSQSTRNGEIPQQQQFFVFFFIFVTIIYTAIMLMMRNVWLLVNIYIYCKLLQNNTQWKYLLTKKKGLHFHRGFDTYLNVSIDTMCMVIKNGSIKHKRSSI